MFDQAHGRSWASFARSLKQPYLTSITRNSNPTDKPEVDGALILLPRLAISAPFYGYLKLLKLDRSERS